jgi:hypothetical protein
MPDGDERGLLWRLGRAARARGGRDVLIAVVVVTSVVVAGCGALSGGTPTPTTPEPDAEDRLSANLTAPPIDVIQRVEAMVGAELQGYPGVRVGDVPTENTSNAFFRRVVGPPADRSTLETQPPVAYNGLRLTVDRDRVAAGDWAAIEAEIAYYAMGLLGQEHGWVGGDSPASGEVLRQSYRYVVDAYAEEYLSGAVDRPRPYAETDVSDYEWARAAANEYYASQWVSARVDSPADVPGLLTGEDPPSSEAFLIDDAGEPKRLDINVESAGPYEAAQQRGTSHGAVTTKAVLRTELDEETAATAAEGWGQDRYVVVDGPDGTGVVWVHRWDSETDADEFESAMGTYLDGRREEAQDLRFESRRLAEDATAVVVGSPAFADATNVSYEPGNVTVDVGTTATPTETNTPAGTEVTSSATDSPSTATDSASTGTEATPAETATNASE